MRSADERQPRSAARPWHWAWLAVAAAVLPYLATLRFGFVFDDIDAVVRNPMLRGFASLPRILAVWQHDVVHFRPVRYLSLALDWNLGHGAPWLFHATNILIHAGCAVLLGTVVLRLLRSRAAGGAAAVLFAVLPCHAATVAYVSAREDLLATACYLLAVHWFLGFRAHGRRRDAALSLVAGVLSGLSKETAATLPVTLWLLDAWLTAREHPVDASTPWQALRLAARRSPGLYLAWLVVLLALLANALVIWPATRVPGSEWGHVVPYLGTALRMWPIALAQLVFPWRTIPDRLGMVQVGGGWSAGSLLGMGLTVGLVVAAWRLRRSQPGVSAGITFLLLAWLPTAGILPLAEVFAEHYLYLPSCGVCLAAAAMLTPVLEGVGIGQPRAAVGHTRRGVVLLACVALGLAGWAFGLSRAWATEQTVWEASLRANPHSFRAAVNLSGIYAGSGRTAEADSLARHAVALAPDAPVATAQLISTLVEGGQADAAVDLARKGIARFPEATELREALAVALVRAQRPGEAEPVLAELVAREGSPYLLGIYGQTLYQLGRAAQAESVLTRAIAADSTYSQAWTNLGLARWAQGRTADAEAALRRAIALAPADADPHNNLAVLLFESGRVEEAAQHAQMSVRLGRPLHPDFERALQDALANPAPRSQPGGERP